MEGGKGRKGRKINDDRAMVSTSAESFLGFFGGNFHKIGCQKLLNTREPLKYQFVKYPHTLAPYKKYLRSG
jgi:hypothetical protein